MPTIAIQQLKAHPAQMRTTYDLETLAGLTLQVYERGLDQWQPIAATPHPGLNGAEGGDGYHIVSGHRRHMAQLLAFALRDWAKEHPDTEITIDVGRTMLTTLVESLGSLEALIASLLGKYGAEEIPFVLFEGSQKAQILALQAANYGSDQPDMLGVAHSFRQALLAGATPEEIARNCGQHLHFVRNHLALADIPPDLAQRVAAGDLPLSVATAVADLPEPKKTGLSIFILANDKLTARDIKECAAVLKKWPGLQLPLMSKHQSQRNIARALVALWGQAVAAFPEDAYAAASMFIFRGVHDEPWAAQEKLTLWFQALGGDTYFTNGSIHWAAIVQYLVPEVSCETCPIKQLPQEQLRSDLSGGQGGPLGMPCRVAEDGPRCIHGLAANDPVDVRVPWDWSEHPGVVKDGADYRVKSYEALLAAWQAQQAKELAEDEESERQQAEAEKAKGERQQAESALAGVVIPKGESAALGQGGAMGAATAMGAAPATADNQEAAASAKPAPDAPIVKQRALIAQYMQRHE
ncbi:MAG: hypothetical protein R6X34_28070, partial [Chloroflexota bacterium]